VTGVAQVGPQMMKIRSVIVVTKRQITVPEITTPVMRMEMDNKWKIHLTISILDEY
jgi:hypothetical protein